MISLSNEMFLCEHLGFDAFTTQQVSKFKVKHPEAINLEFFLKESAPKEQTKHSNRTYLIRDKHSQELACYFSLRNGLFTLPDDSHFSTIPAVELSNFAVNNEYKKTHPDMKRIGSTVFADFIIPLVKMAQDISGVQALYIYALPNDKLIDHYASLGFMRFDPDEEAFIHNHVKPLYDKGCVFMCQGV